MSSIWVAWSSPGPSHSWKRSAGAPHLRGLQQRRFERRRSAWGRSHGAESREAKLKKPLLENTILDPSYWTKPLLGLWQEASLARRERLVRALEMKTALHHTWLDGELSPLQKTPGRADGWTDCF
jgi:hypothetical protein